MQLSTVSGKIGSNALVSLGALTLELWLGSGGNFWSQSLGGHAVYCWPSSEHKLEYFNETVICIIGDHHLLTSTQSMGAEEQTAEIPLKCLFLCTLGSQQQLSHSGSLLDLLMLAWIIGVIQIKPLRAKLAFQSSHSFRHKDCGLKAHLCSHS